MEQQKKQAAEEAQAKQNQPTPESIAQDQIKVAADQVQVEREDSQLRAEVNMAKISAETATRNKETDVKFLEIMSKIQNADLDRALEQERVDNETALDAAKMVTELSHKLSEGMSHHEEERET
jgi:hypothetical protein